MEITDALDIYSSAGIRETLLRELADAPEVALDLSQVKACDAAGLQVVLAAMRTAREAGKSFRVTHVSDIVTSTAQGLGLELNALIGK